MLDKSSSRSFEKQDLLKRLGVDGQWSQRSHKQMLLKLELARHDFCIENTGEHMSIEQMYYCDYNEKRTQIGKIDGTILNNYLRVTKDFWTFWMQTQGKTGTTMRFHSHSNKKASKSLITEVNEQGIFRNEPQENQWVYEHGGRCIQW